MAKKVRGPEVTEQIPGGADNALAIVPQPWEKQIGESDRAFSAFVVYRDLPPNLRNYKAVVEQLYPGTAPWAIQKVSGWASKYFWESRASKWQAELDRTKRESQIETIKTMGERHARVAMAMLDKGEKALHALSIKDLKEPSDIRQFIVEATKLERQTRALLSGKVDLPDDDERLEREKPAGLSGASDDELERIDQAAQKHIAGEGSKTSS